MDAESTGSRSGPRTRRRDPGRHCTTGDTPRVTALPVGDVTFVFTDVEGSTRMLGRHPKAYAAALLRHDALLRDAVDAHGGFVFETIGDAVYAAFGDPGDAIRAALDAQVHLQAEPWGDIGQLKVRMAMHGGPVELRGDHYFGAPLYRCARLMSIGHGAQTLVSRIVADAVGSKLPSLAELRPMGSHRLKDLAEPEEVFQLAHPALPADFPPLKSLDQRTTSLPLPPTSFIGREDERKALHRLVEESRLVTLTGPGGVGKSRLALQVATESIAFFDDGVVFVPLAPIKDPAAVGTAVAQALTIADSAQDSRAQSLSSHLAAKELLLVLDNFEQVLDAGSLVSDLLAACPHLKVLVTSRVPLHLSAERQFAVPPLAHARRDGRLAKQSDATVLFLQRALAVNPQLVLGDEDLHAVAEICARLDGLPLAVELAAARSNVLSPRELSRLLDNRLDLLTGGARDADPRQRSLRATMDWSFDLLSESERALFRRSAVFVGGASLDAVAAVCGPGLDRSGLDLASALVNHSLLLRELRPDGSTRFAMLETILEYARERFISSGEADEMGDRHARYYAAAADRPLAPAPGSGTLSKEWLELLDVERHNISSALSWLINRKDTASAADLVRSVWPYWMTRGHLHEGRSFTEQLLTMPGIRQRADIGRLLSVAGEFPRVQGDHRRARELKEEGLAIHRRSGTKPEIAADLHDLGMIVAREGDRMRARALHEEALRIRREIGDADGISHALNGLTVLALLEGDYARAAMWAGEELAAARVSGVPLDIAYALHNLGEARRGLRDPTHAAGLYLEALTAAFAFGDVGLNSACVNGTAHVASDVGDSEGAARLFGASERMFGESGFVAENAAETTTKIAAVRSAAGPRFHENWQIGREMNPEEILAECTRVAQASERNERGLADSRGGET